VPEHLRSAFLDAPFAAALQVFETALSEKADGLLLAGNIVDFDLAGPRAVVFLVEQFERLAARGISVYWAGGEVDPADSWPASVALPDNVHIFPVDHVETIEHLREDKPVALIQGISRGNNEKPGFHRDTSGLFTLGIAACVFAETKAHQIDYLALGGHHQPHTLDQSPGITRYSGTPQGRNPSQTGPRGCTVVSVDEAGEVRTSFVATDTIRWLSETVEITAGTDEDALLAQIAARIDKLQIEHHAIDLLITWRVEGHGQVLNHIRRGGVSDPMVELLREQQGDRSPAAWTVSIECDQPLDVPQEWIDEETIMGDMLREFRALDADVDIALELEEFLPKELRDGRRSKIATVCEEDRACLLRAASKMAVDLLDGEEELSIHESKSS